MVQLVAPARPAAAKTCQGGQVFHGFWGRGLNTLHYEAGPGSTGSENLKTSTLAP
jgi:hypothetical protein